VPGLISAGIFIHAVVNEFIYALAFIQISATRRCGRDPDRTGVGDVYQWWRADAGSLLGSLAGRCVLFAVR